MKRVVIVLGVVFVMVLSSLYAFAYGPGFGPRRGGGYCWELNEPGKAGVLTPEQRTRFQELRQRFLEETAKLREDLFNKRTELQSLWSNPKTDPKTLLDKERELRDLQNQVRDKALQFKLEARQYLTPEQIAEFGACGRLGFGFGGGKMKGYGKGPGRGPSF